VDEAIEDMEPRYSSESVPFFYYRYNHRGRPVINVIEDNEQQTTKLRTLRREDIIPAQSILSQRKDPELYPELSYLGNKFADIGLYRNWQTGRDAVFRKAQQTDLPEHPLLEDGGNLGLVLNNLQLQLGSRQIIKKLQLFYDAAEELNIKIYGGTVQIFIRETGLTLPIPATRLSDGTLRYLFLIALLLDPTPPPLICIEEPEIGLHPDILPVVAEMLIEASQRTQLIVTTHSDALVSALSPESVLICDRDDRGSHLRRLDPEPLKKWLENYSLGDLWRMGEIGGNRW
jgi:predicted ATPase